MPRPEGGYRNAAGDKVPGVHDITGRYKDPHGLYYHNWQQGRAGLPYNDRTAADIGTAVHRMVELDLRRAPEAEVAGVPQQMLQANDDIDTAHQCHAEWRRWRADHDVRVVLLEEPIVSERFQYGGTPDLVAVVDGALALLDVKTAKTASEVWRDQRLAMSAHHRLVMEARPDLEIKGFHLLQLPKDGGAAAHHMFPDLAEEWDMFWLQLECLKIERRQAKRQAEARAAQRAEERAARKAVEAAAKAALRPQTVMPAPRRRLIQTPVIGLRSAVARATRAETMDMLRAYTLVPVPSAPPVRPAPPAAPAPAPSQRTSPWSRPWAG